jgi:pentatricopeptide repeat protein
MKAAGLTPDVWAYAAVIEAHRASGSAAAAEAVYREMGNDGVAPNVACFNALLRVYNVAGKLEVRAVRFALFPRTAMIPCSRFRTKCEY